MNLELNREINNANDGVGKIIEIYKSIELKNTVEIPSNKSIILYTSNSEILLTCDISYINHIVVKEDVK